MDTETNTPKKTNTERYQQVDNTLPEMLPAITREEATKANRLLCKHFGKSKLGPVSMPRDVVPYATRVCWLSPKPTRGSNHDKGWGRLIHDVSHYIFQRRHPSFRPHDGGHVTLEREIAEYVVAHKWLEGKLKPKVRASRRLTSEERRDVLLRRTAVNLARWESKYRRADAAIKKLKRRQAALIRQASRRESSFGSTLRDAQGTMGIEITA